MQKVDTAAKDEAIEGLEDYADVATWINDVLSGNALKEKNEVENKLDLTELEARVSQLSVTLEVACEDTSAELEKTIDDISRTVPRLTYDLQLMQENALSLQRALTLVEDHSSLSTGDKAMSPVLEELQMLDTIKRNMEASLAVLREAEAWSSLESEVVSYLAEQSYSKAASRLSEAAKSLGVFQNTPEFESRKTLMVNLQNQLEAALSSALVSGINNNDIDACKRYFEIFCHIEREAEFRSYWNGSKRKKLLTLWEEAQLRDCETALPKYNDTGRKLALFLPEFFHELLSVLQVERLAAVLIFPDPQPTLSTFIATTFASLQPSLSLRLNGLSTFYGSSVLPDLISSYKATEEFAVATDKIMEKVGYTLSPSVFPSSSDDRESQPLARRRSTRQSFSRRLNRSSISGPASSAPGQQASLAVASLDHSWEEALLEPFLDYQCDYASLEKRFLSAQLESISAPINSSLSSQGARVLRERAVDVLGYADDALARCLAFTYGYGVAGLIQALDDLFRKFFASVQRDILEALSKSSGVVEAGNLDANDEFAELDYSPSDLAVFQTILHLLEATRNVLDRMNTFEMKLRSSVVQTSISLRLHRTDPLGMYVSGTTRTALSLLHTSALNSLELQELHDAVNPEQPQQQQPPHSAFTPSSATHPHTGAPRTAASGFPARTVLLLGARQSISDFARACQNRLQETILAPLMKHFATYPSSAAWAADTSRDRRTGTAGTGGGGAGSAVSEVTMPTFSLSPTAAIQRVAEGLLSLPRLFEVYADDDALAFSIETLPFIDEESLKAFATESISSLEPDDTDGDRQRPKPRHLSSSSSSLSITVPPPQQGQQPTLLLTPEAVSSAWLASLALALLSHLTENVLPSIPRLGAQGAAQLAEDLSYLGQIARALSVEWPALEAWREAVSLDEDELRSRVRLSSRKEVNKDREEKASIVTANALKTVGKLRGYTV